MPSILPRIARWRLPADCYAERDLQDVQGIIVHYISAVNVEPRRWGSTDVAWHAGASALNGRSGCNEFCVGIGLVATADSGFTSRQYAALKALIGWLRMTYPTIEPAAIQGHEDVAIPAGRKSDPGPQFDWRRLEEVMQ